MTPEQIQKNTKLWEFIGQSNLDKDPTKVSAGKYKTTGMYQPAQMSIPDKARYDAFQNFKTRSADEAANTEIAAAQSVPLAMGGASDLVTSSPEGEAAQKAIQRRLQQEADRTTAGITARAKLQAATTQPFHQLQLDKQKFALSAQKSKIDNAQKMMKWDMEMAQKKINKQIEHFNKSTEHNLLLEMLGGGLGALAGAYAGDPHFRQSVNSGIGGMFQSAPQAAQAAPQSFAAVNPDPFAYQGPGGYDSTGLLGGNQVPSGGYAYSPGYLGGY